jgi:nucleotide-binding universal stress UspA family protein
MYKRILVPVDGSAPSNAALQEALKFAGTCGSALRLVYVCEPLSYILAEGPVDLAYAVRRQGEQVLDEAAAKTREAGVSAETALIDAEDRRVAAAITEEAGRAGSDLIMMGTHGRRGFEHLVLGSVAEGVLRRATVPVLLLRPAASETGLT